MVKKVEFEPLIDSLPKENLSAKFTPNFDTKRNMRAGYYFIKQSPKGPVLINYTTYDGEEGEHIGKIHFKMQDLDAESWVYDNDIRMFKRSEKFIKNLSVIPTGFSIDEGVMQFNHFLDGPDERAKINKHYLYTRVVYDTMFQMINSGERVTRSCVNGKYIFTTLFPNGGIEIISAQLVKEQGESSMIINLTNIGLKEKFGEYTTHQDMMVYQLAQRLISGETDANNTPESFYRLDDAYMNMMKRVVRAR